MPAADPFVTVPQLIEGTDIIAIFWSNTLKAYEAASRGGIGGNGVDEA